MIRVSLQDIVSPDWGWHLPDDAESATKLKSSLSQHGQLSALVVRQTKIRTPLAHAPEGSYSERDVYEVIDGRRRVEAMRVLGWSEVWVLDKGEISVRESVKICLTLELGAETDFVLLARHIKELSSDDDFTSLPVTTPFTAERLTYFKTLCDFDWSQYQDGDEQVSLFEEDEDTPPPVVSAPDDAPSEIGRAHV